MLRIRACTILVALGIGTGAMAREIVPFSSEAQPGTVVVKTQERRLYLVLGDGTAIRYPVAVGRPGKQWEGYTRVCGQAHQPGVVTTRRSQAR